VGLAIVLVRAGRFELDGEGLIGRVEVVLVVELVHFHARGHGVLVEDHVVREALVVNELDLLALGHIDRGGEEGQSAVVTSHLHRRSIGRRHQQQSTSSRHERLPDRLQGIAAGRRAHGRHTHHGGAGDAGCGRGPGLDPQARERGHGHGHSCDGGHSCPANTTHTGNGKCEMRNAKCEVLEDDN
jgi:hypothetical protein